MHRTLELLSDWRNAIGAKEQPGSLTCFIQDTGKHFFETLPVIARHSGVAEYRPLQHLGLRLQLAERSEQISGKPQLQLQRHVLTILRDQIDHTPHADNRVHCIRLFRIGILRGGFHRRFVGGGRQFFRFSSGSSDPAISSILPQRLTYLLKPFLP